MMNDFCFAVSIIDLIMPNNGEDVDDDDDDKDNNGDGGDFCFLVIKNYS